MSRNEWQARVVAGGVVAVLLFDVIASVAARALAFPYVNASVGSYFIYLAIGFVAGREAHRSRAKRGAIAAAVAGFADASAGWALSWIIGPGRPPSGVISVGHWVLTAAIVVLLAAATGFFGGAVGARSRRNLSVAP